MLESALEKKKKPPSRLALAAATSGVTLPSPTALGAPATGRKRKPARCLRETLQVASIDFAVRPWMIETAVHRITIPESEGAM